MLGDILVFFIAGCYSDAVPVYSVHKLNHKFHNTHAVGNITALPVYKNLGVKEGEELKLVYYWVLMSLHNTLSFIFF